MTDPASPPPDPQQPSDHSGIESVERLLREARARLGSLELPAAIGHYRIDGLLGSGGMGDVYVATDDHLGRQVALKTLRADQRWSPAAVQRFEREAKLAARLEHPGICRVYEAGQIEGVPFLAMQLLPGQSLAAHVAARRELAGAAAPSPRTHGDVDWCRLVVALCEQVARALDAAHAVGLVHRDVKPSNIQCTDAGTAVLVDFGVARDERADAEHLTGSAGHPGTLPYMAPEQLTQGARVSPQTDVWGLGITLYEALTLELPFAAVTQDALAHQIRHQPLPDPRRRNRAVDDDLRAALETATAKSTEHRYRTAAEFADDLARWLRGEPLHARPVSGATRAWRWVGRNRLLSAFVVAQSLAVVALALAWQQAARVARVDRLLAGRGRLTDLATELAAQRPVTGGNVDRVSGLLRAFDETIAPLADIAHAEAAAAGDGHDAGATFLRELAVHGDAQGAIAVARRDAEWARTVADATVTRHRDAWERARVDAKAEVGIDLAPIPGLVPLGCDPASRLPEFALARSGAIPVRDAAGKLQLTDDFAVVFVLVPGGTSCLGAQSGDPAAPNYDPDAAREEDPVRRMTATPFLLSKYELTRGQWMRLSEGPDPSQYKIGQQGYHFTERYPVDDVTWRQCEQVFTRHGLAFPTEAQWEYAARAGSDTPYPWGRDPSCLAGHANTADKSAKPYVNFACDEFLEDQMVIHAPVGSFAPNAFGLHDVVGNVSEYCDDEYGKYSATETDAATSMRTGQHIRVERGGNFTHRADGQRVTMRASIREDNNSNTLGVRPAMRLPHDGK